MTTAPLDPMTLGITLSVLGMGGTLFTLYAISLIVDLLKRLFPIPSPAPTEVAGDGAAKGAS